MPRVLQWRQSWPQQQAPLSPSLSLFPRSVRYNLISVSSVAHSDHKRKGRSSKHDDFDDLDDFVPASAPIASIVQILHRL